MKRLLSLSLLVLLILLCQYLPSSTHEGVLDPNLHHGRQLLAQTKDLGSSLDARKLQVYIRKKSGGGGAGGVATRTRGRTSSAIRSRPPFPLHVFLSLSLFLGVFLI
ncbi:hypothetical protein TIFTF001_032722 [Ficus carica]|uniref:Uncharacterized protein n=1 Tax=Ficus carica TaxID=3494 RepID=A0AA88E0T1_FICCA|nr:hypothetical protein TIFTF001_032659 [Ficus carica]GMN63646.1 hypothetical protein TIFTF001_032722 [Ficus carica]